MSGKPRASFLVVKNNLCLKGMHKIWICLVIQSIARVFNLHTSKILILKPSQSHFAQNCICFPEFGFYNTRPDLRPIITKVLRFVQLTPQNWTEIINRDKIGDFGRERELIACMSQGSVLIDCFIKWSKHVHGWPTQCFIIKIHM